MGRQCASDFLAIERSAGVDRRGLSRRARGPSTRSRTAENLHQRSGLDVEDQGDRAAVPYSALSQ
jgi:hypothetical protein